MEADWKVHPERYRFRTLDEYMELFIGILRRLRLTWSWNVSPERLRRGSTAGRPGALSATNS